MTQQNPSSNKVKFPDSLNIGGFKWAVKYDTDLADARGESGSVSYESQKILVKDALSDPFKATVLLHEAIHAMRFTYGIRVTEDEADITIEEKIIRIMGFALFRFFQDNDLSWLLEYCKREPPKEN